MSNYRIYISKKYIDEKSYPIRKMLEKVDNADSDDLREVITEADAKEIAFAFAVIAKELNVTIPDV